MAIAQVSTHLYILQQETPDDRTTTTKPSPCEPSTTIMSAERAKRAGLLTRLRGTRVYCWTCWPTQQNMIQLLSNQTPWSWALLAKPPVAQLLENFPTFYGSCRFITVFTRAVHWSLPWARSIQSIPLHLSEIHFNIIHQPTSWSS
jgi:hypothetical protein